MVVIFRLAERDDEAVDADARGEVCARIDHRATAIIMRLAGQHEVAVDANVREDVRVRVRHRETAMTTRLGESDAKR